MKMLTIKICYSFTLYTVGNKAKGRISKRVLQRKKNSYPLIRTHTDTYIKGLEMLVFRKIWRALFSFSRHRFEICPFAFLPTILTSLFNYFFL